MDDKSKVEVLVTSEEPSFEEPTTAFQRLEHFLTVEGFDENQRWTNPDMSPTPLEQQTWKPYHFMAYWISDSYNAASWRTAGSFLTKGLSPGLVFATNLVGHLISATIIAFNGLVGSKYHIPFSVQARATFGFYFSYVVVFMRFVVGAYYYGINAYTGAECVQTIILAMSPKFANMKDTIPGDATTSEMLLCYFIYTVICIPFHYIKAHHIRYFLVVKMITGPIVGISMMIYLNCAAGGPKAIWTQGNTVSGSTLGWLIVQAIASSLSSYSTLAVNVNDFTRYSKNKYASMTQMYAIPFIHGILTPMGIVGGTASAIIYGTVLWDPLLIAQQWITTPGGRAAAFFVGVSFLIAQIGINISANSISAANDLTAMFPKYINIRRGQFIVMVIGGWALCPWEVIADATTLTAFMGGYSIFLGPIAACLACDYFFIHKTKYDYTQFYDPKGIYKYNKFGTNWRVIPPMLVGFVPLIPGLSTYINTNISMPQGMLDIYLIGYMYSFPSAFLVYYLVCKFFPATGTMVPHSVTPPSHEEPFDGKPYHGKEKAWKTIKYALKSSIV